MGGFASALNPVQQCLSQLSQVDLSKDTKFWNDMQIQSSNLSSDQIHWYPGILHQIAKKQPENMVTLVSFCVTFIENLRKIEPSGITAVTYDRLNIISQIFTSSCSVVLSEQRYSALVTKIKPYILSFLSVSSLSLATPHLTGLSHTSNNASPQYLKCQYDIIHSILCTINLNYFTRFVENPPLLELLIPDFPGQIFYKLICELKDPGNQQNPLFRNCIALSAKLEPNVAEIIAVIEPEKLMNFFLNFRMDQYTLTFLFQCLLNNKKLVTLLSRENSNLIIYKILNFAQLKLEAVGISFIHTLATSSIRLILENPDSARNTNGTFSYEFTSKFQPQPGTFADVLIEVLFNVCNTNSLIPTFTEIFHLLSPHILQLSVFCSVKMIDVFQIIMQQTSDENKTRATGVLLEAFATLIQRREGNEFFRVILAQRTAVFQFIKTVKPSTGNAIGIIHTYLSAIREKILKTSQTKVDFTEINNTVLNLEIESLFPEIVKFQIPHLAFAGRIEGPWAEWCEVLFLQCFKAEFEITKQYDASISK